MTSRRTAIVAGGLVVSLALLGLLLALSDAKRLAASFEELSVAWALAAVAASVLAYALAGIAQQRLLAASGETASTWAVIRATTLAAIANRHVRSGGAAGVATLSWLLHGHGVRVRGAVVSSLGVTLATNTLFTVMFALGIAHLSLASGEQTDTEALVVLWIAIGLVIVGLAAGWIALAAERARRPLLALTTATVTWVGRRVGRPRWGLRLRAFADEAALVALDLLVRDRRAIATWVILALRLALAVVSLHLALLALSLEPSVGVVVLAYGVSKTISVISIVPGGIGLVEGGLVGVLVAFDFPYEPALLAALLYRAAFDVVPGALALATGWPLLQRASDEPA